MDLVDKPISEEDERKMKNLATRIMSNGVEVLVKDKNGDLGKNEQRRIKLMHITSKPAFHLSSSSMPKQSLLSSAVATVINHQQMSGLFPLHQLMHHNYIIKTCLTTFTYLTTIVQNKRSAISTFETIVSVVTTESLTNLYATDLIADIKPTKTKFMEVKTIQPSVVNNIYQSDLPKIDKRIDDESNSNEQLNFDLIQPSEPGHTSCTSSCSCSHTKTEGLKTKYNSDVSTFKKLPLKTSKYGATKVETRPTGIDKKTQYGPYEYESSSQTAPTDKLVEKYTEVINDYSDEKQSGSVEESELLTNEQAPSPPKTSKVSNKNPEKTKPEKPQKPNQTKPNNKNKVVADLLKLGSLGIKGLSQLAPVLEKMTGGFMKRQDVNKTTSTTTVKPVTKITPYQMNKRIDSDIESNQNNFPIYIPVDEMETSESQMVFSNATLHQNLAWAAEHKHPKAHMTKMVHESPLVNGGIPISPGEIITANSDVIVGKPAVGGPLTLAASGIRLQNPVNPPPLDSYVSSNEHYVVKERPGDQSALVDDSFDLRPPGLPKPKAKPMRNMPRPSNPPPNYHEQNNNGFQHQQQHVPNNIPLRPFSTSHPNDNAMKTEQIQTTLLSNHGRPAFSDFIPSLAKPDSNTSPSEQNDNFRPFRENKEEPDVSDNSPSSSELVNTRVKTNGDFVSTNQQLSESNKPFLVDIQPSRVANVIIPHGSSTALVFTGSSEPHKTGDYVDDPLPYPEPGYFGSFSIDAPQMTNVHNVPPNTNKPLQIKTNIQHQMESHSHHNNEHGFRNEVIPKWKENKRPVDFSNLPPPTSKQESHFQYGPQITVYNPEVYKPSGNGKFEKYNQKYNKDGKEIIDKDYENYLAVPPPPPPKKPFNGDRPYNQKPIVHTKPVQDMKVFLNIQHPVPKLPNHQVNSQNQDIPPKVTSEIYFAAQNPQNTHTPTYTIHIPNGQNTGQNNYYNQVQSVKPHTNNVANQYQHHQPTTNINQHFRPEQDSFTVVSSPSNNVKPGYVSDVNVKENTYTVTLNTATNVINNVGDSSQIVGSNVPVPIGSNSLNGNIPIGTNFAIKVEGGPSQYNYDLPIQGNRNPPVFYNEHGQGQSPIEISVGDHRWNTTDSRDEIKVETSTMVSSTPEYIQNTIPFTKQSNTGSLNLPSMNSHANFPMMNEYSNADNVKPVTEFIVDTKPDQKRPAKLIPNVPTNSHGWHSSIPVNEINTINNIKLEATTRKAIPLLFEYNHHSLPNFGQKITSAGKPPSEFWAPNTLNTEINTDQHSIKEQENQTPPNQNVKSTPKPSLSNYIPHNFGVIKQPVYDIPIRDNSDETTTILVSTATNKQQQFYEDAHAIYDGEEESDSNEADGEISQESVKVPVVTSSEETDKKKEKSKSSTEITLLQDKFVSGQSNKDKQKETNVQFIEFNPGTQTEKPFDAESYNKSNNFHTNSVKPIYENNPLNRPRPFTVNTATTLDHQLQQPHWQINQMVENATNISSEDNIDLNIGEEMNSKSTQKPSKQRIPYRHQDGENKHKRPQRPIFSLRGNDSNIITSTVHIQDKKPLTILDDSNEDSATLPSITSGNFDLNRSSSEIIDLSPPPPTMDYSFKPSTADEMIMGMSPPPPGNSIPPMRPLPTRSPITPRPLPVRTPPPYRTNKPRTTRPTQRPSRKPVIRDDVSTYRPAYDTITNARRPIFEHSQPSSQLLPPPREAPSRINPVNEKPSIAPSVSNLVFPTPISSGWLTSSGVGFSSSFGFGPTSIYSPAPEESKVPEQSSTDKSFSYYYENESLSTERIDEGSSEKPITNKESTSKETSTERSNESDATSEETNVHDSASIEISKEDSSNDKKVIPLRNKNKTRKPYPVRDEDKKTSVVKYKLPPSRPIPNIKPTRTLRPELYPTRQTSIRKIIRPLPTRPSTIIRPSVIESSETFIDDGETQPSEVHKENEIPISQLSEKSSNSHKTPYLESSLVQDSESEVIPLVKPTHHAGNEVKVSDEIVPTKTEFRTTVITMTKTLSEPPQIVSSIGYVNLTHTLTVTHTMTSLISQSEGAITQTLVLTNTHTSTIVDVVTEIHTQVQPTTIIETVTKHIPIPQIEPTPINDIPTKTKIALDDLTMSSEERENFIIHDSETTENVQKIDQESENDTDTFFVVMNKSQNGGQVPPVSTDIETGEYDGITRNEQVNSNGVSQVLFGEILLAGTPYLETTNVVNPAGVGYGKECQPDCKASRNERCQRIDGIMKCVCRPGFARMFPDRPCKPTYTYSVKLALSSQGNDRLQFHSNLADNSSSQYNSLALATHEGINRMVMQSDLRDVYHGVHINGFHPVDIKNDDGETYQGVMNDFYVQLSDNAHESRLKEVIEKYLRTNNYSLGGTEVFAASELMDRLNVSDFDECMSGQFHDCSEHAQCFNLRGTYTCSCLEGYADLSVNPLYPGRICSAEPVGCERCNYHGACYSRDDRRVLCECFQWYAGSTCHINLKVVLISLVTVGALLTVVLVICAVVACSKRPRPPPRSIVTCIQAMPSLHQGVQPSKQRADRRALITERGDSGDASSIQNASLPYMPAKKQSSSSKKMIISEPPAHEAPPPPAPAVMIPRARLHPPHRDSREMASRKQSMELSSEAKLISYLESGANISSDEMMRRKHSMESSYSAPKDRVHHGNKQGALVSAGFKVSTTIRPDDPMMMKDDRDDLSSVNKNDLEAELHFDSLRKSYSQEDISEWTDAERRIGELTLSEARSVGGTLPASTGRAASSTRLTHQEANTMAERDLGSTFLLPHVHLYKPDITSDVSEFDSL